nr:unnamed protein product [Callosobruchus analis]
MSKLSLLGYGCMNVAI